jgi:hypothetical protein
MEGKGWALWAAGLLLLSATGLAQLAQAGDILDAALVARREAATTTQTNSVTSAQLGMATPSNERPMAAVDPECDGRPQPAGVLTHLLNRLKGQASSDETKLCTTFPEEGMANRLHE